MKDKLVKNHHKGIYFALRKWTLILLAGATFIVAIVVPTYIVSNLGTNQRPLIAEEEPAVTEPVEEDNSGKEATDDDSESETPFTYEEYNQNVK